MFFFSSRSRHTRLTCDWSSDVCSSDLGKLLLDLCGGRADQEAAFRRQEPGGARGLRRNAQRSEERRVGKEYRWWWSQKRCRRYNLSSRRTCRDCSSLSSSRSTHGT